VLRGLRLGSGWFSQEGERSRRSVEAAIGGQQGVGGVLEAQRSTTGMLGRI
jgi:hypothetical protein